MKLGLGIGVTAGPYHFTPTSIAGASLRLIASAGITLNAGNVSAWADQSGNGNNLTQSDSLEQALFVSSNSAVGGQPTVRFPTSGSKFLNHPLGSMSPGFTIWAVVCSIGASTTYESLYGNASGLLSLSNGSGVGHWGSYLGGLVDSGHAIQDGNGHAIGWVCAAVNGTQTFCTDGIITTGTGTSAYAGASGKLGDGGAGAQGAGCDLAELVVWPFTLTTSELLALNAYAQQAYVIG